MRKRIMLLMVSTFMLFGCGKSEPIENTESEEREIPQLETSVQQEESHINETELNEYIYDFPTEEGYQHNGTISNVEKMEDETYLVTFSFVSVPANVPLEDVQHMQVGDEYISSDGCAYRVLDKTEDGYLLAYSDYESIEQAFYDADEVYCLDETVLTNDGKNVKVYFYSRYSTNPMKEKYRYYTTVSDISTYIDGDAIVKTLKYGEIQFSEWYLSLQNESLGIDSFHEMLFECDEKGKVLYLEEWYGAG